MEPQMKRYVRITQSVLNWVPEERSLTLTQALATAHDLGKEDHLLLTEGALPELRWGSGIYEVQADDTLRLVKSKFDTSG